MRSGALGQPKPKDTTTLSSRPDLPAPVAPANSQSEAAATHLDKTEFKEQLLQVMERKSHWAWSLISNGQAPRERLHLHFEQEYATYVRDFPVLVGRAYVQCPIADVRRDLAENLFEEETGGLVAGKPHPTLFLEYPRGLGMDLVRFEAIQLGPRAQDYRDTIDELTLRQGWEVAAAVTTLFIEGTAYDRGELDASAPKRPSPPLEQHPLVVHYGLPLASLALTKAHRNVEGEHRAAAWRSILGYARAERRRAVVEAMQLMLTTWLSYRDEVAEMLGFQRP